MRPPFKYMGSKWLLAPTILAHIPPHQVYVEVFGGSASVLLQKDPSRLEVFNDLDQELVNFFRVLREQKAEFLDLLRGPGGRRSRRTESLWVTPHSLPLFMGGH
jgi:site-specific DNA-adenine methylase